MTENKRFWRCYVREDSAVRQCRSVGPLLFMLCPSDLSVIADNTLAVILISQLCYLKFQIIVRECQLYHLLIVILIELMSSANTGKCLLMLLRQSGHYLDSEPCL